MRSAWLRILGMTPVTSSPVGPFPDAIDTTIFIRKDIQQLLCRIHAAASMADLYRSVSILIGKDARAFSLLSADDSSNPSCSSLRAGHLYGNTLRLHLLNKQNTSLQLTLVLAVENRFLVPTPPNPLFS